MIQERQHGDFSGLADDYSKYRPGYSGSVLTALLALVGKPASAIDAADVGAGTGIWTRMLAARGLRSVTAVEPNDDMRRHGEADSRTTAIAWRKGNGEATGLADGSADLLSMASSFHWVDFEAGTREFARVLRPGGRFVALWNPRLIEVNPLLVEIEEHLNTLKGGEIRRVSSGRSGITEQLTDRLNASSRFDDVMYLEARHTMSMSPDHYLGVWRSVNDLRVQLGAQRFTEFLAWVERKVLPLPAIEATYLTRAWTARRR
jgi:SAM-dependent methyltransferase